MTTHTNHSTLNLPLMSLPMCAVLSAQFLSALADNALLIAAIALIRAGGSESLVPVLQEFFVVPFILLAPFVGQLADALPKGRVMLLANGIKLFGATAMFAGLNPLLAYGIVGVGAAAYSPAKYGILSQLFSADKLVRANGLLEGSTIAAILLGVFIGGILADDSIKLAFAAILLCYGLAALANLLIPKLPAEHPLDTLKIAVLLREFWLSIKLLFANHDARFSLLGTSLFWGSGTTLRLLLFAWVPVALLATDNQTPAMMMAIVSIGIVIGAALAGAFVSLKTVNRALLGGLLIGPLVILLSSATDRATAMLLLAAVGVCGGFFVVPLNALLQDRGHASIGAGRALAVQNFCENLCMLSFVAAYATAAKAGAPVVTTVAGFGAAVLSGTLAIAMLRLRRRVAGAR